MAIKQSAINRIAYPKRDHRNRSRMERGLFDGYNSLPGEVLTIRNAGYRNIRITSDKRTLYGAQHVYHAGWSQPNYPVPAIRNSVELMPDRVILWTKHNQFNHEFRYLAITYDAWLDFGWVGSF